MKYPKKPTAQVPAEPVRYSKISAPAETKEIFRKLYIALKKQVTSSEIILNFEYTKNETDIVFCGADFKLHINISEV